MLNRDRTCLDDIITELRDRMIVDLGDLEALVREDVFAWCAGAGADAFVDVIASVWPREEVPAGSRRVLAAAFLEGSRSLPWRDLDIGPNADAIRDMLTRLSGAQPALRTSLRAAAATMRYEATGDWSAAMHEASWAALTTGRIRAAAAAQFMAVRAWFTGGFEAMDGAEGLWNMISGCVQANVIADVLADDVAATLNRGWRSVCG